MRPETGRFSDNSERETNRPLHSENENGAEIAVTNYGGAVLAIMVPDKNGKYANVIQGHDSITHVINSHEPFLSTLIGRYGNRIAGGKFI